MNTLHEQIIKEMEARGVVPKPRWQFLATRLAFWLFAIVSVAVGGTAFAIASFVFFDNDGMSVAALEQSSIYDIAQSIPFVWLFVLALFIASAYYGFRRTRSGYRYTTTLVVLISVVLSVLFGMALNTMDFGQTAHYYLLHHTGFYDAMIHSRDDSAD